MGLTIEPTSAGPAVLAHIGFVEDVIAAKIPEEISSRRYEASDFSMGFELASPKGLASLGEAVLVNGYCYTCSTDRSSKEYDHTIFGKQFIPGGMFLIPKDAKPSHRFRVDEKLSMEAFYQKLYGHLSHPLAFAGIFHFADFHGIAIGKPPVNGRNIFTHKDEYYLIPDVRVKDRWGFVIGAASNFTGFEKINEQLKAVLYKNPMDATSSLINHAHVLLLKKKIERFDQIAPAVVDQTLHLFIDGTSMIAGEGEIFLVAGMKDALLMGKKWK